MGKIAFVFSGQGDQYAGMGRSLSERYPAAARVFAACDRLRPGTSAQCFAGSEEELKETKNTQPCLFAYELALAAVLEEQGVRADLTAGFSLGEVAALTYAGAVEPDTGFSLVCRRGELMQEAAEAYPASMAAVVKLPPEEVSRIAAGFDRVYPVNFNSPGQVSVAGEESSMAAFCAAVKEAGGRAIPLRVKGGFHSPFMDGASERFAQVLGETAFAAPRIPLYSDVTAQPYGEDFAGLLAKQIRSPVLWERLVRNMIAEGTDTFVEIGPGKTLCGLISRIEPSVRALAACGLEQSETILDEVKTC